MISIMSFNEAERWKKKRKERNHVNAAWSLANN
jgi:hypothetical protein